MWCILRNAISHRVIKQISEWYVWNLFICLNKITCIYINTWASLMIRTVKNLSAMKETWVESLGCAYLYIHILFNIHVNSSITEDLIVSMTFYYQFYYCKMLYNRTILSSICVSH